MKFGPVTRLEKRNTNAKQFDDDSTPKFISKKYKIL